MFRFLVDTRNNDTFELSKETLNHIKVARVTNKQFICVFEEKFYVCELVGAEAKIIEELDENHEHNGEVILAAGIIDTKRFEWMIQKATELGVTKIVPLITDNISKKLNNMDKRIERWNQIAKNATEQSFRNKILEVTHPIKFTQSLEDYDYVDNKYIAHEKVGGVVDPSYPTNSIFYIGPEGGFSENEIEKAKEKNIEIITLGKRILRAETASIFVASKVI